ncbi:type VI secretion system baseplate subunit TssK [Niveispirillum fermenti]|uniref:type VI secretion system baseplate subunit TssK n=1 Tax=Niveispirillum fermenti TaxID=1233113 RepID=UPI003A87D0C9
MENRVVWSQGLFIRPQHFQQMERHIEWQVQRHAGALGAYGWGVTDLSIDLSRLRMGEFALARCAGIFPDGTPFQVPETGLLPPSLTLPSGYVGLVYLALPQDRPGQGAISDGVATRYGTFVALVRDTGDGPDGEAVEMRLARLNLSLHLEGDVPPDRACIAVARVQDVAASRQAVLDDGHIPSCLTIGTSPVLRGFVAEVRGLVAQRRHGVPSGPDAGVEDWLLLTALGRAQPLLAHMDTDGTSHPEALYRFFLSLAGELSSFTELRHVSELPPYRHDDLRACFGPLMWELRRFLSARGAQVVKLGFEPCTIRQETWFAVVPDADWIDSADFVLSVKTILTPEDTVNKVHAKRLKIYLGNEVESLRKQGINGFGLQPLERQVRHLPAVTGRAYFRLEKNHVNWRDLHASGRFGLMALPDVTKQEFEILMWVFPGGMP